MHAVGLSSPLQLLRSSGWKLRVQEGELRAIEGNLQAISVAGSSLLASAKREQAGRATANSHAAIHGRPASVTASTERLQHSSPRGTGTMHSLWDSIPEPYNCLPEVAHFFLCCSRLTGSFSTGLRESHCNPVSVSTADNRMTTTSARD